MSAVVVRLDLLAEAAKSRPEGYYEEVLAAGVVGPLTVRIPRDKYKALVEKYNSAPSLLQKAKNFTSSAARHIASGMPMCDQAEVDRRFAICRGCEFYKDGACQKCGCPLKPKKSILSKLSWANEKCPIGKWGPVGQ